MTSERLKRMDQAKKTARKASNQVRLTLPIAEAKQEWMDRWEDLQNYANQIAADYCRKRGIPNYRHIAEEALSEAWRYVCDGEKAEKAIDLACNKITQTARKIKAQSQPLPEIPEHSEEYQEGESAVRAIVQSLPERLRALAYALSWGMDNNCEIADLLNCAESSVRNWRRQLTQSLTERYGNRGKLTFLQWMENAFCEQKYD